MEVFYKPLSIKSTEGALDLPQPRTGPVATPSYSPSIRFTWDSAMPGKCRVYSPRIAVCMVPSAALQSKGDGMSHPGKSGGEVSVPALQNNALLWQSLFIEHDSLCLFKTGFQSPLGLWDFTAQAPKQNIVMVIQKERGRTGRENLGTWIASLLCSGSNAVKI